MFWKFTKESNTCSLKPQEFCSLLSLYYFISLILFTIFINTKNAVEGIDAESRSAPSTAEFSEVVLLMDMKRMRRQWPAADPETGGASSAAALVATTEKKPPRIARLRSAALLLLLLLFSLFLLFAVFSGDHWNLPLDRLRLAKYGTPEETAKGMASPPKLFALSPDRLCLVSGMLDRIAYCEVSDLLAYSFSTFGVMLCQKGKFEGSLSEVAASWSR